MLRNILRRLHIKKEIAVAFVALLAIFAFLAFIPVPVQAVAVYSYDADNLVVTVTGSTATLAGWYAADVAGGWGTITRLNTYQYFLDINLINYLYVGDGSTTTLFSDSSKQLYMNGVYFVVAVNATLRLGTLQSETDKTTKNTFEILSGGVFAIDGGTCQLYGCAIRGGYLLSTNGTVRLWGCQFNSFHAGGNGLSIYNCVFNDSYLSDALGTFELIHIWTGTATFATVSHSFNMTNLKIFSCSYVFSAMSWSGVVHLINLDSPNWASYWFGLETNTGTLYRDYTFDLITTPNATVEITYYGLGSGTVYNATDADGILPTLVLRKEFYNYTSEDDFSYSYEPYHIKITKDGYIPYEANLTVSEALKLQIHLVPVSVLESELPVGLAVGGLFAGFVGVIVFAVRKKR